VRIKNKKKGEPLHSLVSLISRVRNENCEFGKLEKKGGEKMKVKKIKGVTYINVTPHPVTFRRVEEGNEFPPISQVQNMVKYIVDLGDGKYWVEFPSFTVPLEKGIEKGKINNEFFFRELSASSSPSSLRGGWKARSGIS